MTDFDCVIIASVDLGPPAIRQLSLLLDAHRQARIRTGILSLRSGRTDLGWLGDDDVTGRFDDDVVAWLDPEARCSAPLTLILSPVLALIEPTQPLRLFTRQGVVWPIQDPLGAPLAKDEDQRQRLADLAPGLARRIAECLDAPVVWAARTAGERHFLAQNAIGLPLADWVWWPILKEAGSRLPKEPGTVGRHWLGKAPLDPAAYGEFAEAFGDCWPMDLVFHGAPAVLESLPPLDRSQGMKRLDEEEQPLLDFLATLGLFVAIGDRRDEAQVPLALFEAMAADAVVIAPPVLAQIIDCPLPSAEPGDLMGLAASLLSDDIAYERARRQQRQWLDERHSARAHLARIAPFLTTQALSLPSRSPRLRQGHRILFVSDDSPHLEHLTRELAIADRLPPSLKAHFVTTARNAWLVEQRGYPVDFVSAHNSAPYHDLFDDASTWNYWFERHLAELITFTGARALVFDGVYPFGGVMTNRKRFPDLRFAWIRQPLWRPTAKGDALRHSLEFDLVIEPGDLASSLDRGPLQPLRRHVLSTAPIRLDEPMARAEARQILGFADDGKPAILIDPTLPAEKVDGETVAMLLDSLERGGASLFAIDPGHASFRGPWSRQVTALNDPAAGRLRAAFDGAVSAADYRSLHDHVAAGLPAVLLSGLGSSTDDQAARAAFAETAGFAVSLRSGDVYGARAAARQLLDPDLRMMLTTALARHQSPNGADMAAMAIADLVFSIPLPKLADG